MQDVDIDKYVAITVNAALALGIGVMLWLMIDGKRKSEA